MISDRISAGGNLLIDAEQTRWRLLIHSGGVERVLLEVESGQPMRATPTFAADRRLPESTLLPDQVDRVAVGWSSSDEAWHLGLVLMPALAAQRGSRWVELAHFPDHQAALYGESAGRAGEKLAAQLNRPFTFVPAKPAPPPQPVEIPAPPLNYPLPIKLSGWTLIQRAPAQFDLVRAPSWGRVRLLRVLWYVILAGVFLLLSVASLTSGIALPRMSGINIEVSGQTFVDIPAPPPETLVIAGFVCAVLMIVMALITLVRTFSAIKRLNIDGEMRQVREMRGRRPVRSIPAGQLESVYASLIVSKFNERRPPVSRRAHYGELALRTKDGKFEHLASLNSIEDAIPVTETSSNQDQVTPLTTHSVHTPIHAAALYVARALDLPVRLDLRMR